MSYEHGVSSQRQLYDIQTSKWKPLGNILEWYSMIKYPKLSYQNIFNISLDKKKCVKIFFSPFICFQ